MANQTGGGSTAPRKGDHHVRLTRASGPLLAGALLLSLAAPVTAAPGDAGALQLVPLDDSGTPAAGKAWVRVLHGSPDAPEVDVYVGTSSGDAAKIADLSGLAFAEASGYVEVAPGSYYVKVCATADATQCPLIVDGLPLAADTKYTVVASNLVADIEATLVTDGTSVSEGTGYVRVGHFSADTPPVHVLTQDKATELIDGTAYKGTSAYLALEPGSADVIVCADGDDTVCPLDPGALPITAGMETTLYAVGSLEILTATDPTDTAPASSPLAFLLVLAGAVVALAGIRRFAGARATR